MRSMPRACLISPVGIMEATYYNNDEFDLLSGVIIKDEPRRTKTDIENGRRSMSDIETTVVYSNDVTHIPSFDCRAEGKQESRLHDNLTENLEKIALHSTRNECNVNGNNSTRNVESSENSINVEGELIEATCEEFSCQDIHVEVQSSEIQPEFIHTSTVMKSQNTDTVEGEEMVICPDLRSFVDDRLAVTDDTFVRQERNSQEILIPLYRPSKHEISAVDQQGKKNAKIIKSGELRNRDARIIGYGDCMYTDNKMSSNKFECSVCKKLFSRSWSLKKHFQTRHKEDLLKCSICGQKFTQEDQLSYHMLKHTGKKETKPFECELCLRRFARVGHLNDHMGTHTGKKEKPFKCQVCSMRFARVGYLNDHMARHTGQKAFECTVCQKRFSRSNILKVHSKIHDENREKTFVCEVCLKAFDDACSLQRHVRIHTGERPYVCEVCGKAFTQSGSLKMHKRCHSGEKPYACDVCKKQFSWPGNLKKHMHLHTGIKPYECHICQRQFALPVTLRVHMRTHSGDENPFECDKTQAKLRMNYRSFDYIVRETKCRDNVTLGKTFSHAAGLDGDMLIRTTERSLVIPYQCDYCERRFILKSRLSKHIRIAHASSSHTRVHIQCFSDDL